MAILQIVYEGDPILRQSAEPVTALDSPEIQQLIDDMIETVHQDGVGLAAPQIGRSLRLAIVLTPPEHDQEGQELPDSRHLFVIVNPKVVWQSQKIVSGIEGCLSIPGYLGEVDRHHALIVACLDRYGRKKRWQVDGWTARIFQHELDHLDGILFTDKLTAPNRYWTEAEYDAYLEEVEKESRGDSVAERSA